jgi:site-specific recombinase XerD
MPEKKSDSVKKEFVKYLDSRGLSPKSHKNYRSDLSHFMGWAILKIRSIGSYVESLTEIVPFLSGDLGHEYRNYMVENAAPAKTVNRRLSTLRNLARFLVESRCLDFDFTDGVKNIGSNSKETTTVNPIFNDFRTYLEDEKVSPNTIKNYLSDIRQFLSWLETNRQVPNSRF